MKYAVEVSGLKKKFKDGRKTIWALKGIDLKIKKGEVFGLLGPNGAGKTTAIYIMTTLLLPTSGNVKVLGHDLTKDSSDIRGKLGICIGGNRFYWDLSPRENLEYYGRLFGMNKEQRKKSTDYLIQRLDITPFQNKPFYSISTGMRQKVAVAKALLNDPEVLFLDEPTAGLDVEVAADIRDFIMENVKERDMTVILTSHQLYEVEEMCKRIAMIDEGRITTEGKITDIRKRLGFPDMVRIYLDRYTGLGFLKGIKGVLNYEVKDGLQIEVVSGLKNLNSILTGLRKRGYIIRDLEVRKADLKDMFLKIVKDRRK